MSGTPAPAVFLSYASQDVAAALRMCEALRAAGVEVWFDQSELTGGDVWDAKIRKEIAECALFVPVISASTQARLEGYFRIEWKLAAQRTHAMADEKTFLLPVVIDDTRDADAKVPAEFKAVQWTRLRPALRDHAGQVRPEGDDPALARFCARVRALLSDEGRDAPPKHPAPDSPASRGRLAEPSLPPTAPRRIPAAAWVAAAAAAVAAVGYITLRPDRDTGAGSRPLAAEKSAAPLTKAQQLVAQARALFEPWDFATSDDFKLAERLLKEATELEPANAEAWAALAIQATGQHFLGFDRTDARDALLRTAADRAMKLAPASDYAQLALALRHRRVPGADMEALRLLQDLAGRRGADKFVLRQMGGALMVLNRDEEALAVFARVAELPGGDAIALVQQARLLQKIGRIEEADAVIQRALVLRPDYGFAHIQRILGQFFYRGDLDGTRRALQQIPAAVLADERVASVAAFMWYVARDAGRATEALRFAPGDYVQSNVYSAPRGLLAGLVHRLAGRLEAAALEWRQALRVLDLRLVANPAASGDVGDKAMLLALLAERPAAEEALRLHEQLTRADGGRANASTWGIYAALGRADAVADFFAEKMKPADGAARAYAAHLRFHPLLDRFREEPRFQALAAEASGLFAIAAEKKTAAAPSPPSEAAQHAARALALATKTGFTRDDLAVAENFGARATDKEPDNAAAWGVRAAVQSAWILRNWDFSEKRRQDTQSLANKALALDPNEPEALLALSHVLRAQGASEQAAAHLRRAMAAHPDHIRLARTLGHTLLVAGNHADAVAALSQVVQRVPRDPLVRYTLALAYADYGGRGADPANLGRALEQLDAAIAIQPFGTALVLKATLLGSWRGDLPGMRATLDQLGALPLGERSEDRAVCLSMWAGLLERRADRVEAAAALTARNYFEDMVMAFRPKAWSLALAHRAASKEALARRDWQAAEAVLRQRVRDDPAGDVPRVELAITLAWLEQREEAANLIAAIEPVWREEPRTFRAPLLARYHAAAGDAARAAEWLARALDQTVFVSRKVVPLDPWWDKVRAAPEFEAVLKAPGAKPGTR